MDRNGDGYISPKEKELGIRKALFKINKRINARNARNGYGYDNCSFSRRPYIQNPYYNNQFALSQFKMLAFFQQIMNNMMNMLRTMMNEQFNRQYGQYDDGYYPYGYCPKGTEQIYDREVDPRTLIKGTPAQPKIKPTIHNDVPATNVPPCGNPSSEIVKVANPEYEEKVQDVIDAINCDAPDSQKTPRVINSVTRECIRKSVEEKTINSDGPNSQKITRVINSVTRECIRKSVEPKASEVAPTEPIDDPTKNMTPEQLSNYMADIEGANANPSTPANNEYTPEQMEADMHALADENADNVAVANAKKAQDEADAKIIALATKPPVYDTDDSWINEKYAGNEEILDTGMKALADAAAKAKVTTPAVASTSVEETPAEVVEKEKLAKELGLS